MQPLSRREIVFRNMKSSPALVELLEQKIAGLKASCDELSAVHVAIERPHRRHRKGNAFRISARAMVPGKTLVASRAPKDARADQLLPHAIGQTFRALQRELRAYRSRRLQAA